MKRILSIVCILVIIPLLVFGEGIDLSRISLTEKETQEMSNLMNMGRYLRANGELWGRSWNNDIFRAKVVSEKKRLKLEESAVLLSNTVSVFSVPMEDPSSAF